MHIEISAGGLSGGIAVSSFQSGMKKYISGTDGMISSFKAVRTATYNLNGGVDRLAGAVNQVTARERTEENRKSGAENVQAKSNEFLDLAVRVDKQVASMVKQDRKELYGKYPSLKPSPGQWVKDRLSDAWNWLCKAGKDIANAAEKTWNAIKDTAQKAWNSIVTFYQEHKKIIDTVLIVVGAIAAVAAVIATGGLALAPLIGAGLTALGVSASTAAAIGAVTSIIVAVIAVTSKIGSSVLNIIDIWSDKSENATFQKWRKVLNRVSDISNFLYSVGNKYNSHTGVDGKEYLARQRAIKNGKMGYGNLDNTNPRLKIENGRDYSQKQKQMIREENMRRNNGVLRDDLTGKKGVIYNPASGEKIPPNALEIDHKIAQANGGPNSFENARLINAPTNRAKSNDPNFPLDRVIDLIPENPNPSAGTRYLIAENFEAVLRFFRNRLQSGE